MSAGYTPAKSMRSWIEPCGSYVLRLTMPGGRSGSMRRSSSSAALRQWHELERAVHALREPKHVEVPTSRGETP